MSNWLAQHALEVIFAIIVALSGGWVGLNKRRERQLSECRARCRKQDQELKILRRDYHQSLEFNLQDRWTIRELAKMVRDLRHQLKLPEIDILLEVYTRAEAEMRARRLSASLHITSSPQAEALSDD